MHPFRHEPANPFSLFFTPSPSARSHAAKKKAPRRWIEHLTLWSSVIRSPNWAILAPVLPLQIGHLYRTHSLPSFLEQTRVILYRFNSIFRYNLCDVVVLVHREAALHLLLAAIAQLQSFLSCHIFLHITNSLAKNEPSKDGQKERGEYRKGIRATRNSSSVMCPSNQGNISKEYRHPLHQI